MLDKSFPMETLIALYCMFRMSEWAYEGSSFFRMHSQKWWQSPRRICRKLNCSFHS